MMTEIKKVLIIEDERPLAKALELKLTHFGFNVKIANDGGEGIDALRAEHFDVVLTDLVMPRVNGFGVLSEIRKLNLGIPVIVASDLSQGEDIEKARAAGAKEYFVKSDTPIIKIVQSIQKYA